MEFFIHLDYAGQPYKYKVTKEERSLAFQTYHIHTRRKTLIFRNNIPLLERKGLKHWKPEWTSASDIPLAPFRDLIIKELNKALGYK